MARYADPSAQPIYLAAARFLHTCLQSDGSLIHDDRQVWTLANLETLRERFVDAPDEGDRGFMAKFGDQVKPAGRDVICLAAEVLAVYCLFPSNVGQARKCALIDEVLGWAHEALPEGGLRTAFTKGIGSGGQGYNTRRPDEITYLIRFALHWKRLPEETRSAATSDPWRLMKELDAVEDADVRQIRHMLLHLIFPEHFEWIASGAHKRRVVQAFASVADAEGDPDLDRRLLVIRTQLEGLMGRRDLDFYESPLAEVWSVGGGEVDGVAPMDAIRHKRQVVLYGPPGTGKTYRARGIADRLIRAALLTKLGARSYFEQSKTGELDKAVDARVRRLQLHPAYGYEDFIRGLHIGRDGATEYRLGYLPRLVAEMARSDSDVPYVLILDELNRTDLSRTLGECFTLLENRDEAIDLPGVDDTGQSMELRLPSNLYVIGTMNLIDQSVEQMDFALRRRFLWVPCPFDKEALVAAAKARWQTTESKIDWARVESDFVGLALAAEELNLRIRDSSLLGEQYEIGHTYLLDAVDFLFDDIAGRSPRAFLWDRAGRARRPVELVWTLSLKPLISEYLAGLDSKTRDAELSRLSAAFLARPREAD